MRVVAATIDPPRPWGPPVDVTDTQRVDALTDLCPEVRLTSWSLDADVS